MFTASKTAGVLITRLVEIRDREKMMARFEEKAREHRATQIGGNHVLEVLLEDQYYLRLANGLQGGPGSGAQDTPADTEEELRILLTGTEKEWINYARHGVL